MADLALGAATCQSRRMIYVIFDSDPFALIFLDFNILHVFGAPAGVIPFQSQQYLWHPKIIRVPGLLCITVCVFILVQYWLVRQKDTRPQHLLRQHSIMR